MILADNNGVLICALCARLAPTMVLEGMVGPGTAFPRCCPHVEVVFMEWHATEVAKMPARWKEVWQPFCIGAMLAAAITAMALLGATS